MNPNSFVWHNETPAEVRAAIQSLYENKHRVRFFFGDVATGRDWMEENDTIGTVGKSTGSQPIPLLIKNSRSMGGGGLLDHCIVKILDISTGAVLYQHPRYHQPAVTIDGTHENYYSPSSVLVGGEEYARCKDFGQAWRLAAFMRGERHAK